MTIDTIVYEAEIRDIATRCVRAVVPNDTPEAVVSVLIGDLYTELEDTLVDFLTRPLPALR